MRNNQLPVVQYLIKSGADLEAKFRKRDKRGVLKTFSALDISKDSRITEILKKSIESLYVDPTNCVVYGEGITSAVVGKRMQFSILSRDSFKQFKKAGGDSFKYRQ